jgi:hypothetical protein
MFSILSFFFWRFSQLFIALGNNRPEILVRLEDQVLLAIMGISEGRPRQEVIDVLYSQIGALEKDLANDDDALNWFNIASAAPISSVPAPSEAPSTPLPGGPFSFYLILHLKFFYSILHLQTLQR